MMAAIPQMKLCMWGGRIRAQQTILIILLATRGRAVWSLSLSRGSPSQPFHSGYDACSIRRKLKLEPLRGQGQDQKAAPFRLTGTGKGFQCLPRSSWSEQLQSWPSA